MKKFLFLAFAGSLIFFSSCKDDKDKEGSVELNFVTSYNGTPIVIGDSYDYTGDVKIQFDNIKFFVSDIHLDETGGSTTSLTEVEFVEFNNLQNATSSAAGKSLKFNNIPEDTYTGIGLNIGLTKALNDTKPEDVNSSSPLLDGNYWSDWESYIFVTISAKADLDNDGSFEQNLVYHIGGEEAITSNSFSKEIKVTDGETTTVSLELDLQKAFINEGNAFDIWNVPQVHKDRTIMAEFAGSLQKSLSVK